MAKIASLVLAAGRGSRMKDFDGSKTLLPLIPGKSHYEGKTPIILEILNKLPSGPKAIVVNHKKEDVIEATRGFDLTYCEQPVLNGTGGALIALQAVQEFAGCNQRTSSAVQYWLLAVGQVKIPCGFYYIFFFVVDNNRFWP